MAKNSISPAQTSFIDEIIVDNFAGGGGASTGIELAAGRPVNIAINHDPDAILLHRTNHPYTEHLQASVWDVDPEEVCKGRPVGLAWFSPDCKHFSKAKGSALVDRNIRGLAWIVLRWAGTVRPRVIILENVEEFVTWGPVRKGKPVKKKAGQTFQQWKKQLEDLGYEVEHREIVAADLGAPTTRKRFVLVARCDGKPIRWPERTHAPRNSEEVKSGKLKPWRSAAEIIDWTLPGYSIFATRKEIWDTYGVRAQRPLKPNTLRRIIRGVDKFTIKSGTPFIVDCNHSGGGHIKDVAEPLNTVTGKHTGGVVSATAAPFTFGNTGGSVGSPACDPVHTIRTAGGQILASANLMSIGQTGGGDRIRDVREPVPTTVSKQECCAVAANLIQYHTEQSEKVRGQGMEDPIMTVDSSNRYGLASCNLVEYYGNGNPIDVTDPLHTVTAHDREGVVSAHIQKFFGGVIGEDAREPLPTVTTVDHNALAAVHVEKYFAGGYRGCGDSAASPLSTVTVEPRHGTCAAHLTAFRKQSIGTDLRDPVGAITSHDHEGIATAHVVKFKGQELGTSPEYPLPTITAQSRAGGFAECRAVLAKASGRDLGNWPQIRELLNEYCGYNLADDEVILLIIRGIAYYISDITLRMLTPRELYNAMGFPVDYIIEKDYTGNVYPKDKQVARCGNAVCPPLAEAMVRANLPEWCGVKIITMAALNSAVAI